MAASIPTSLKLLRRRAVLVLGGISLLFVVGIGVNVPPDEVQERLRIRIEAAQTGASEALRVDDQQILAHQAVERYYVQNGFEPAWTTAAGPMRLADSLLAVLRDAHEEGLRPTDYHVPLIDSMLRHFRAQSAVGEPLDSGRLADFELLCTDAFLLYGSHVRTGRVDPVQLTPSWNLDRAELDLTQSLESALATPSLRATLESVRPPQSEYAALRQALGRYRALADQGGWPSLPDGPKLELGVRNERVPLLRRRLQATNDLPKQSPITDSLLFDERLEQAVSEFQERHGLDADGVVGPATRSALNVPVEARIDQIRVNLERWRWLPQDLGNPHVLVNIAGFWLRVVEDGTDVLQMRVIAGQPYRQTPVFSDEISYLVFNPYWHVPHSIAVRDKLPDFRRDPSLVSKGGYEVLRGWGADARPIDPASIDWGALSASNFPYRLRQRPGPQNALGQVKFMFPNHHNVYLHDTPSRALFDRAERNFSSGCIRVEHPVDLAAYLLRENDGWTRERVQSATGKNTEQTISLNRKVPVHLLYWTAWVDEENTLHFRNDVYDRDDGVLSALTRGSPSPQEQAGSDETSP